MPGLTPTFPQSPQSTPQATSIPRTGDSDRARPTTSDPTGVDRALLRHRWQDAQREAEVPIGLAVQGLGLDMADHARRIRAATATVHGAIARTLAHGTSVDVRRAVLTGVELDLSGDIRPTDRSDLLGDIRGLCLPRPYAGSHGLRPVATWTGYDLAGEVSRRVATMRREDSLAERQIRDDTSHRAGPTMVDHAPKGMAGVVGKRSEVSTYPIGQPGCASAVSRRPLPSPTIGELVVARWYVKLPTCIGPIHVEARNIGNGPEIQVTRPKPTKRGKRGSGRGQQPTVVQKVSRQSARVKAAARAAKFARVAILPSGYRLSRP